MQCDRRVVDEVRAARNLQSGDCCPYAAKFICRLLPRHHYDSPVPGILAFFLLLAMVSLAETKNIETPVLAAQRDGSFKPLRCPFKCHLTGAGFDHGVVETLLQMLLCS
eukprot:4923762-Pleurochrysis_carterae.AAC.1